MSEQDSIQSSAKQRRSSKTSATNQQNGKQAPAVQRPANNDKEAWKAYWKAQGQQWRTEPEIDVERQKYLEERRSITPDIEQGIYPFKGIGLRRADIEWLLVTHENGRGPVDWSDESQRERVGLDLRGADLREENLGRLPLAFINAGLPNIYRFSNHAIDKQRDEAAIHLESAKLHLSHLEGANLYTAHMEEAELYGSYLVQADLGEAHLECAKFYEANLSRTKLNGAHLEGADLEKAGLKNADLRRAHLEGADLSSVHLENAKLFGAHLEGTSLCFAHLEGASLNYAHLEGKHISQDDLEHIQLLNKHFPEILPPADLQSCFFDSATDLTDAFLGSADTLGDEGHRFINLVDVHWNGVNLAVVDWKSVSRLGDEYEARQPNRFNGEMKTISERLAEYIIAVRANRQVALALQAQGLDEFAVRFAYRALVLRRQVLLLESLLPHVQPRYHSYFVDVAKKPRIKELASPPKVLVKWMSLPFRLLTKTEQIQEDILTLDAFFLFPYLFPFQFIVFLCSLLISSLLMILMIPLLWFYLIGYGLRLIFRMNKFTRELFYQRWPKPLESSAAIGIAFFHTTVDCVRYTLSLLLDLLAGYGYKPWRSFVAYLIVILGFATTYFLIGQTVGPSLSPLGSFVFSMTSFHGRGFFPGGIKLDDPLTVLAALEAFVGLLIEVTFIATLTQRLFRK